MARILLLTVDLDLPDAPVNGGVLRVRQLKRHLTALGHEVQVSMPFDRLNDVKAPAESVAVAFPEGRPQVAVEHVDPDVIVCEQWHLASLLSRHSAPLWLDLHGSLLGENSFRQAGGGEGRWRYDLETRAKLRAFGDAQIITCAGHRQRLYFRGWRAIAGRSFEDWEVHHLPLAVEPKFPEPLPTSSTGASLRLLYAGNLWPWINLQSWLPVFFDVVAERPQVTVDFFVDDPLQHRDGVSVLGEAGAGPGWRRLLEENRVHVSGRIAHDEFVDRIGSYDAAVDLFAWNSERELALTTRTLEYLSFGLPVLYPSHSELAETISEIDGRWVVGDLSRPALESAIDSITESCAAPEIHRQLIRKTLEKRSDEAASRCERVMNRLEHANAKEKHDDPADRRLVSLANDVVRGSLAELKNRFNEQQTRAEGAEDHTQRLRTELEALRLRETTLAGDIGDRDREISGLRASIQELERERDAWRKELATRNETEKMQRQRHGEEVAAIDARLGSLGEKQDRAMARLSDGNAAGQRRLIHEMNRINVYQTARQTGATVAAARPGRRSRGITRRFRLWWLYLDHLAVRLYLAAWQRIRRRRIFPGM